MNSFSIFNDTPDLADLSEMIFVEGGKFIMGDGSYDDNPKHEVELSSFYIGKYPATQVFYEKVMGKNPSRFKGNRRPVENVNWNDTKLFFEKLKQDFQVESRLPTEAEWEYSARGGIYWQDNFEFSGGDNLDELGWYGYDKNNSYKEIKPVGLKLENQLGLYDMSGNVWEWCRDLYGKNYYNKKTSLNPENISSWWEPVFRGGSWYNDNVACRVTYRTSSKPTIRGDNLGFRLVCSVIGF